MPLFRRGRQYSPKYLSMEKDFIAFLDHVYEPGYGLEFKENNPSAFYQQLERFSQLPKIPKYETIVIFQTTQWDE